MPRRELLILPFDAQHLKFFSSPIFLFFPFVPMVYVQEITVRVPLWQGGVKDRVVPAAAWVTAVVRVQSLVWEFPHARCSLQQTTTK